MLSSRIKDSSEGYGFNVVINQLVLLRQVKIHSPVTMAPLPPPPDSPTGLCIAEIFLSRERLLNLTDRQSDNEKSQVTSAICYLVLLHIYADPGSD